MASPDPADDPFADADRVAPPDAPDAEVTSRILAKHKALKAERGGSTWLERTRAQTAAAASPATGPRAEVVIGIIIGNGWIEADRIERLREFVGRRGVTQVLRKRGQISLLLAEHGLLAPHHARELELTLLDLGIFPRYRITRLLRQGSVGRTYRAVDLSTGSDVDMTVFREALPERRQRFLARCTALEGMRSRRIVQAIASGSEAEALFTAAAPHDGERLSTLLAERRIRSEVQAIRIAVQIAEGLAYIATTASLSHGNLSPENILVRGVDEAPLSVVLADVALAEQIPACLRLDSPWLAPECRSGADGGVRADIYAVGAILYNLLGSIDDPPHPAADGAHLAIDLSRFHPLTSDVIYTATNPDPAGRFRDYKGFIATLVRLVAALGYVEVDELPVVGPVRRSPASAVSMPTTTIRRRRDDQGDWIG